MAASGKAAFPIFANDGIETNFNDEHPLNADSPISVTDEGISTFTNELHSLNAQDSILIIEFGNDICLKDEH